jgi:hypothetical protein
MQCQALIDSGLPVLVSFGCAKRCTIESIGAFSRVLIDSGAFSALNTGKVIDLAEYVDFAASIEGCVDAIAGLDDISGDWRKSLRNYERVGFPTFHETDPDELLDELIHISRERGRWLGLGLLPPRQGKEGWLRSALERIPDDIHVHGWALREYSHLLRLGSVDSTNWWRDGLLLKRDLPWLTVPECLDLICLRYKRAHLSSRMRQRHAKEGDNAQVSFAIGRA